MDEKVRNILEQMGAPTNPESMMGSMISMKQLQKVDALVQEATLNENQALGPEGSQQLTGISSFDRFDFTWGAFYPPTVLSWAADHRMVEKPIWQQERFGPVVYIICFDKEGEAIKLVNDDEFGRGASI